MLQRGHSDFAWFRDRAGSLHSDSVSQYTEMASSALQSQGPGQLNPEPSIPEERAEHNLPPKSYAAAISDGPNVQNGDGVTPNGHADKPQMNGEKTRKQLDEEKVVYEKHVNHDGEVLTSIKPSENYERSLQHNGHTAPREKKRNRPAKRQDDLASGRQAGAGWERSAYAYTSPTSFSSSLTIV